MERPPARVTRRGASAAHLHRASNHRASEHSSRHSTPGGYPPQVSWRSARTGRDSLGLANRGSQGPSHSVSERRECCVSVTAPPVRAHHRISRRRPHRNLWRDSEWRPDNFAISPHRAAQWPQQAALGHSLGLVARLAQLLEGRHREAARALLPQHLRRVSRKFPSELLNICVAHAKPTPHSPSGPLPRPAIGKPVPDEAADNPALLLAAPGPGPPPVRFRFF
jgi:hypothetical protein